MPTKSSRINVFSCTLGEDETIARLATGVRRFQLPDEHNFIKLLRGVADRGKSSQGAQSLDLLAQIFENRVQYPQAAEIWRRGLREYGDQGHRQQRLDQIVKNWGRFEFLQPQPAGGKATVEFRYRNGRQAHFQAWALNVDKLLSDVKLSAGQSQPAQWQRLNISDLGARWCSRTVQCRRQSRTGRSSSAGRRPPRSPMTVTTPLKAGAC